jgi:hypothetical protein
MTKDIPVSDSGLLAGVAERQRAAHLLWREGYMGSSYALTRSLVLDLLEQARTIDRLAPHRSDLEALARSSAPSVSGDIGVEQAAWLERARALLAQTEAKDPRTPTLKRRRLIALALLFVVTGGLLAWLVVRSLDQVSARASDAYAKDTGADLVTDGIGATEWLLPDKAKGWLELELARRRVVNGISIENAHNRHYLDRATRELRIEAFDGKKRVFETKIVFQRIEEESHPVRVALPRVPVSRLRFEVLSHHGSGAGLAEIRLE